MLIALALVASGWAAAALLIVSRRRRLPPLSARVTWLGAGAAAAAGIVVVVAALHVMTGRPPDWTAWLVAATVTAPLGVALGTVAGARAAAAALTRTAAAAGLAVLVATAYLLIVVGIGGTPSGHERDVLLSALLAALVVAIFAAPVHTRVVDWAQSWVGDTGPSTEELATGLAARMTRALPMDELLLQIAESLRAGVGRAGAEIWTGTGGVLTRAVAVPSRPPARLELTEDERTVVARARIGGGSWSSVWLPRLREDGDETRHRVVPIAHLGELLGLLVVRRAPDEAEFADGDESALVELARQLGLALHNVRLDSALQASLAELADRNEQLQASRLRVVTAADDSRRQIERNLHDGAQQHLVALSVKLGLARAIADDGETDTVVALLDQLRDDVQATVAELRELAHGIYPPLLRNRGLGEALRTAAGRSPLPCTVEVLITDRYPEPVETAAYFCCLEAMQNAAKYAGDGASIAVVVQDGDGRLCVQLRDDGAGYDTASTPMGHGFVNMQDRLGALGGELDVTSAPGEGTSVRIRIPARPLVPAPSR